ncbi:MAG: hypothetical protein HYU99_07240 [Deltaproteobacteria bacterium]|nr:hypothetical protein [Deltaproteobacteria bacterium]
MDTPPVTGATPLPPEEPPIGASASLGPDPEFPEIYAPSQQPPVPEQAPNQDLHALAFIGDNQYYVVPYIQGFYRSLALNTRAAGHRLPAVTLFAPSAHETLIRESIPDELRPVFQGMISTGDVADVASLEEWYLFVDTLRRLETADPNNRTRLFMVGNHEVLHAGSARSGTFGGLLTFILNLQGNRHYASDIHGPEVGGVEKRLDKAILIPLIFRDILGHKADPVPLFSSSPSHYRLKGGQKQKWGDKEQVYSTFWKQEHDGSYHAPVKFWHKYKLRSREPEQTFLYTSAIKMADLQTADGIYPVYFIGLDTMDYLRTPTLVGALTGKVSPIQVKLIQAFMAHVKKREPGALFVLGGHYPVTSMEYKVESSGLNKILSDDSVIAYIGAHTHKRDYVDLASNEYAKKYGIARLTPLPEITVPSATDYPNEMMLLKYGVENRESNKLVFEFQYRGIDPSSVPGKTEAVDRELEAIKPHLCSLRDALAHIDDPALKEFGTPETPWNNQFRLLFDVDKGIKTRSGTIHDFVVAEDVIPAMVEDAQLYIRLFMSVVKLALVEGGMEGEALKLEKAYLAAVEKIDRYYENIHATKELLRILQAIKYVENMEGKGEHPQPEMAHLEIDALTRTMNQQSYHVLDTIGDHLANSPWITDQNRKLLASIIPIVEEMPLFVEAYREWLIHYETLCRTERSNKEIIASADLFGNGHFRNIWNQLPHIPYGSQAFAFKTLALLESSKQEVQFYKGLLDERLDRETPVREVPDVIRLEISTGNGGVSVTDPPPVPNEKEERRDLWGNPPPLKEVPGITPLKITLSKKESRLMRKLLDSKINSHGLWRWMYYFGPADSTFDVGDSKTVNLDGWNDGVLFEVGNRIHLIDHPRISLSYGFGLGMERNKRFFDGMRFRTQNYEGLTRVGLTLGESTGLFDIGAFMFSGPAFREPIPSPLVSSDGLLYPALFFGVGGQFNFAEGAISLELGRQWDNDPLTLDASRNYYLGVAFDVFRLRHFMQ